MRRDLLVFLATIFSFLSVASLNSAAQGPITIAIDPGTVTTAAPNDGVYAPMGLAVDTAGNLYIAETNITSGTDGRVLKIDTAGNRSTIGSNLASPEGIAYDPRENCLYVADYTQVAKIALDGGTQTVVGTGLVQPRAVTVDSAGDIYVVESAKDVIAIPADGSPQRLITTGVVAPYQITTDKDNNLYVVDESNGIVTMVPASGGSPTVIADKLNSPYGILVDSLGNIFITEAATNTLVEILGAGRNQILVPVSNLVGPRQLAIDSDGFLYLSEWYGGSSTGNVLKIDRSRGSLNFGSLSLGYTSPSSNIVITNQSQGSVIFQSPMLEVTGDVQDFQVHLLGSGCVDGMILGAGNYCWLAATFSPQGIGTRSATVTILDNASQPSQVINLTGNGLTGSVGTISVTTNLSAATFSISGPISLSGSGTNSTFPTVPIGPYSIAFGAVPGYLTPPNQSGTLSQDAMLSFVGSYSPTAPPPPTTGTIEVSTNSTNASFTLNGPISVSGTGLSASFTDLPAGDYTISFGPNCRSDLPASSTKTLVAGSTVTFVGTYAPGFLTYFPLKDSDPCNATITAVFDHSSRGPYTNDNMVVAYTGESGFCDSKNPEQNFDSLVGTHQLGGYRNINGSSFVLNGHYTGGGIDPVSTLTCKGKSLPLPLPPSNTFLFYDGHPGYDYQAECGTPVYAAVSGTVHYPASIPGLKNAATFHALELDPDPPNGNFRLFYLHISTYPTMAGSCNASAPIIPSSCDGQACHVDAGQLIGRSGDAGVGEAHLHFEVQTSLGIPVDPYGWKGTLGNDPYKDSKNKPLTNKNLWQ